MTNCLMLLGASTMVVGSWAIAACHSAGTCPWPIQQPSQNRGGRCQFFNEAVHGIAIRRHCWLSSVRLSSSSDQRWEETCRRITGRYSVEMGPPLPSLWWRERNEFPKYCPELRTERIAQWSKLLPATPDRTLRVGMSGRFTHHSVARFISRRCGTSGLYTVRRKSFLVSLCSVIISPIIFSAICIPLHIIMPFCICPIYSILICNFYIFSIHLIKLQLYRTSTPYIKWL